MLSIFSTYGKRNDGFCGIVDAVSAWHSIVYVHFKMNLMCIRIAHLSFAQDCCTLSATAAILFNEPVKFANLRASRH
jgi:hypothetical protein